MSASDTTPRFRIGDRVRVESANPTGNPRTPAFIRGKSGVVTVQHGRIVNPIDHHAVYPPLYGVLFRVNDVFGGESRDTLLVDLHEEWLTAAR